MWIYCISFMLNFWTSLSVYPAIVVLVNPQDRASFWTSNFFLPICCFLIFIVFVCSITTKQTNKVPARIENALKNANKVSSKVNDKIKSLNLSDFNDIVALENIVRILDANDNIKAERNSKTYYAYNENQNEQTV